MPGPTSRHTPKERRQEHHIEEGYERRGVSEKEATRRAWATVNKVKKRSQTNSSKRGKP